nr:hypothetical protein [Ruminococcus sp.]
MSMKFRRIIALLLVMVILLPTGGEIFSLCDISAQAYSEESEMDEASEDAYTEYLLNEKMKAGDWNIPRDEGLPWNYFHNKVQDHIRKNNRSLEKTELSVTKRSGRKGRVDLWREKGGVAEIWEVKPGSFLQLKKYSRAFSQLYGYKHSTPDEIRITEMEYGNDSVIENGTSLKKILYGMDYDSVIHQDVKFNYFTENGYCVLYGYFGNGIVLYWFKKLSEKESESRALEFDPEWFAKTFLSIVELFAADYSNKTNPYSGLNPEYAEGFSEQIKDVDRLIALLSEYKVVEMYKKTAFFVIASQIFLRNKVSCAELNTDVAEVTEGLASNLEAAIKIYESEKTVKNAGLVTNAFAYFYHAGADFDLILNESMVDPTDEDIEKYELDGFYERKTVEDIMAMLSESETDDPTYDTPSNGSSDLTTDETEEDSFSVEEELEDYVDSFFDYWSEHSDLFRRIFEGEDKKYQTAEATVYDPLILDLNNNGYEINTKSTGAYFDLNCDGFAEKINWTTSDAILAIDKNSNGKIDDGNEVFGDSFILENGEKAKNGFEALSSLDTTGNKLIDSRDEAFDNLLLWIDSNGNGKS